jgi:hypothetical protein
MPAICQAIIEANGGYFIEKDASKNAKKKVKETVY